jgi:hypothetical protein
MTAVGARPTSSEEGGRVTLLDHPRAEVDTPPPGPLRAGLAPVRAAASAVAAYLTVRLIGIAVLTVWGGARGDRLPALLGDKWDSIWLLGIVTNGYDTGVPWQSNLAFFPLYPGLVRGVVELTAADPLVAGVLLSWVAGAVAAWGLYALGAHLHGHRVGVLLAVCWGVLPHAVVESMAYTESLFTALAVWTLLGVLRQRWLTAGALCLLAGLARPTASALVGAVCLAALVAIVRRRGNWRAWLALLLAPAGWVGYLIWVGARVGRVDGWFHLQQIGWGSSWDGGGYTLATARDILRGPEPLDHYLVTGVLLCAVALLLLSMVSRQPWPLLVFSGLLLLAAIGTEGFYHAKARLLVPAFPLLLPVAVALARSGTVTRTAVLVVSTLASAYFGGYLLLEWTRSP